MNLPPLLNTLANSALEAQLRVWLRLDPFWREQMRQLNGLHLYIELVDLGFKRVIQFGPTDVHCLAPHTQAQVKLITRRFYLTALKDAQQTEQAIDEGHIQLTGETEAIAALLHFVRCHHSDWETQLAQLMPDALAYQWVHLGQLTLEQTQQMMQNLKEASPFSSKHRSTSHSA